MNIIIMSHIWKWLLVIVFDIKGEKTVIKIKPGIRLKDETKRTIVIQLKTQVDNEKGRIIHNTNVSPTTKATYRLRRMLSYFG